MNFRPILREAVSCLMSGEDDKALSLLQEITQQIETEDQYKEAEGITNLAFDEEFESFLYASRNDMSKVNWIQEPLSLVYVFEATVYMNRGDFASAVKPLQNALRWNPVSAKAQLALADAYMAQGDAEKFFEYSMAAFPNIFHSEEMGQAYRNIGAYYTSTGKYMAAMSCFGLSMLYEQSEEGLAAISQLLQEHANEVHMPDDAELPAIAAETGFPVAPHPDVYKVADEQIAKAREEGDEERAQRFCKILDDLKLGNEKPEE